MNPWWIADKTQRQKDTDEQLHNEAPLFSVSVPLERILEWVREWRRSRRANK